jgi:hypothetical protein
LFVRVQTFNLGEDESSEEAFNNPVCLQGRVTPPCFGRVGDRQKCLFFYEHMLFGVSEPTREGTVWESRRTCTCGHFWVVDVDNAETCLATTKICT